MKRTYKGKWGIDSNIVVYSLDRASPYFQPTKYLFSQFLEAQTELFICQQNILETERVLINVYRLSPERVVTDINRLLNTFKFTVLSPLLTTLHRYHLLLQTYKMKDIFDLYLMATYLDNKVNQLATFNVKDFPKTDKFTAIKPF